MKIIKKTIYSWDEFRSVLDNEPKLEKDNSDLNVWSSKETTETDDWYGTKSWLEAMFILDAGGWGIPKLERTKIDDKITDSIAPLEDYLTEYVPTVAGGTINIEAAIADSSPEHFMEEEETETVMTKGKRLLTIYVNCWNHCGIPEDCYFHRGALIYKAIDHLETLGYGCEVIATFPCRSGQEAHVTYVKVKDFQEMMDIDKLCITMCATFMMRRFLFHLQELEPLDIRKKFGYFASGGYGTQIRMGTLSDEDIAIQQDSSELIFWYDVSGLERVKDIEETFIKLVETKFNEVTD